MKKLKDVLHSLERHYRQHNERSIAMNFQRLAASAGADDTVALDDSDDIGGDPKPPIMPPNTEE